MENNVLRNALMRKTANYCVLAGLGAVLGMGCREAGGPGRQLVLAEGGKTEYVVVAPDHPGPVDAFAIKELTSTLRQATGAEFKSVPATDAAKYTKRIFVGAGPDGAKSNLAGMEDQDSVCESSGADVCLYGKGIHGNLYAVYDFLEGQIGCRWFSAFAKPNIPRKDTLRLSSFNKKTRLDFKCRTMYTDIFLLWPEGLIFPYRNRLNMGLEQKMNQISKDSGVVDEMNYIMPNMHTIFCYLPPQETPPPGRGINAPLKWLKNKNYFATNPEFFSMDENGKRVMDRQLCFSNSAMRKELTANIVANIEMQGGKGIVEVSQNDNATTCCCSDCAKLQVKLGCPGGPMLDYVIELCEYLKDKYPGVIVRTYAYNKGQSQEPPTKIDRLPGNLMIMFGAVQDNFTRDWSHPSNQKSYQDLQQWCRLCPNVMVWYYSLFESPYYGGVPYSDTQRLISDMRLMKKAGVHGPFLLFGFPEVGFTELKTYLSLKLMQSVGQDAETLIAEFMDFQYGKAAPAMRRYHDELENCRNDKNMGFVGEQFSTAMFPYLTPRNILLWERNFDEMEELTKNDPWRQGNVRATRCPLDGVVLEKWQKLTKAYPEYFKDAKLFEGRIRSTFDRILATHVSKNTSCVGAGAHNMKMPYSRLNARVANLDKQILSEPPGGKPVPAQFAGISKEMIRRVVPKSGVKPQVNDPDAAFGVAAESVALNPFPIGFYDLSGRKHGRQRSIQGSEISTNGTGYHIYKLGSVELAPDCYWWCGDWSIQAKLGQFYEEDGNNKWDIYVSLKIEGPSYFKGSIAKENRVLCDQVILIKADGQM